MTAALQALLNQAERERDQALAALAQAEQQAQRLQQQAEQLHQYRGELRGRHPAGGGQAAPIGQLRVHQGFSGRLEEAIDQQHLQRLAALDGVERRRQALLALELRVASVRKLLQRRQLAQHQLQARREQRQTDETAQHQARRLGGKAAGSA
jgi:flagellar FliJ protein